MYYLRIGKFYAYSCAASLRISFFLFYSFFYLIIYYSVIILNKKSLILLFLFCRKTLLNDFFCTFYPFIVEQEPSSTYLFAKIAFFTSLLVPFSLSLSKSLSFLSLYLSLSLCLSLSFSLTYFLCLYLFISLPLTHSFSPYLPL